MRSPLHQLAVLGLVAVVVACGDSGTSDETTPVSIITTPTATATVPASDLETMLLDVADVGPGWELGNAVNDQDFADVVQLPCPDTGVNPTILERLTGESGIQFSPTDRSYRHIIETLVTGEPQRLTTDLEVLFDAVQPCPPSESSPGTPTPTYAQLDLPLLGDQRLAAVFIGAESKQATWHVRTAWVRVGSVAMTLRLTEILATPDDTPQVADAEFVQLAETAAAKLTG